MTDSIVCTACGETVRARNGDGLHIAIRKHDKYCSPRPAFVAQKKALEAAEERQRTADENEAPGLNRTPYEKRRFAEDVRMHGLAVAAFKAARREAYKTRGQR